MSAFRKFDPASLDPRSWNEVPAKPAKPAKVEGFRRFQPPKAHLKLAKAADTLAGFRQALAAPNPQKSSALAGLGTLADAGRHIALIAVPQGVPVAWAEGVVRLLAMPAPQPYDDACWQVVREDAFAFLTGWAAQAHGLGWTELDCFGVHRHRHLARLDSMGLVPALDSAQVVALTPEGATVVSPRGTRQTIGRPTNTTAGEVCPIWDLALDNAPNQRRLK